MHHGTIMPAGVAMPASEHPGQAFPPACPPCLSSGLTMLPPPPPRQGHIALRVREVGQDYTPEPAPGFCSITVTPNYSPGSYGSHEDEPALAALLAARPGPRGSMDQPGQRSLSGSAGSSRISCDTNDGTEAGLLLGSLEVESDDDLEGDGQPPQYRLWSALPKAHVPTWLQRLLQKKAGGRARGSRQRRASTELPAAVAQKVQEQQAQQAQQQLAQLQQGPLEHRTSMQCTGVAMNNWEETAAAATAAAVASLRDLTAAEEQAGVGPDGLPQPAGPDGAPAAAAPGAASERWLLFEVVDTGVGIAPEGLQTLFKEFVQGTEDEMRKPRSKGGTGLGLSICSKQVGVLGGRIGALSAPGKGSIFWFKIPVMVPLNAAVSGSAASRIIRYRQDRQRRQTCAVAAAAAAAAAAVAMQQLPGMLESDGSTLVSGSAQREQRAQQSVPLNGSSTNTSTSDDAASPSSSPGSSPVHTAALPAAVGGAALGIAGQAAPLQQQQQAAASLREAEGVAGSSSKGSPGQAIHVQACTDRVLDLLSGHGVKVQAGKQASDTQEGSSGSSSAPGGPAGGSSAAALQQQQQQQGASLSSGAVPPILHVHIPQQPSTSAPPSSGPSSSSAQQHSPPCTNAPCSCTRSASSECPIHPVPQPRFHCQMRSSRNSFEALNTMDKFDVSSLKGLRVLLAEDNLINQAVAKKMLTSLGIQCVVAVNGAEAVREVQGAAQRGEQYNVVLMDMAMPVMGGVEATQRLRAEGHILPIIAMTANASERDQEECREAGMDGFLSKPVLRDQLGEAISTVLRAREAHMLSMY
jgi:CheY-like chemotaxis protein